MAEHTWEEHWWVTVIQSLSWYISTNYEHSLHLLTLQTTLPGAQALVGYYLTPGPTRLQLQT